MKYSIDLNKNTVSCDFSGDLSAEKLIEEIQGIRNDPDFHKSLNTIADIRKANLSKDFLEMNAIAGFVKITSQDRGDFKLALITEQSDTISADLYKVLSKDGHVQVFFNEQEAEAWITPGNA